MTDQFRITNPGTYRTRGGEKAEVLVKNPNGGNCPWIGYVREDGLTWRDDGYISPIGGSYPSDIVAEWVDEPKTERVGIVARWVEEHQGFAHEYQSRMYKGRYDNLCAHTLAPSEPGFIHYIYDIDGIEVISSLPCGWAVVYDRDSETGEPTEYFINHIPPDTGGKTVFPVAWLREIKEEGGE